MTWMVAKALPVCLDSDREDKGVTVLRGGLLRWKSTSCAHSVNRDCYDKFELRQFENTMALGDSNEWAISLRALCTKDSSHLTHDLESSTSLSLSSSP